MSKQSLRDYFTVTADERGWNLDTQLNLLLTFIDGESGVPRLAFENFIDRVITEEDDASIEQIEDEPPDPPDEGWVAVWRVQGDTMDCPNCGAEQIETQDKITVCRACGWQRVNPAAF